MLGMAMLTMVRSSRAMKLPSMSTPSTAQGLVRTAVREIAMVTFLSDCMRLQGSGRVAACLGARSAILEVCRPRVAGVALRYQLGDHSPGGVLAHPVGVNVSHLIACPPPFPARAPRWPGPDWSPSRSAHRLWSRSV